MCCRSLCLTCLPRRSAAVGEKGFDPSSQRTKEEMAMPMRAGMVPTTGSTLTSEDGDERILLAVRGEGEVVSASLRSLADSAHLIRMLSMAPNAFGLAFCSSVSGASSAVTFSDEYRTLMSGSSMLTLSFLRCQRSLVAMASFVALRETAGC